MMVNPKPKVHSVDRPAFVLRGGKGPGSRQPVLKLASVMPNGKRTTLHPMTWLMREREMTTTEKTALAKSMGIKPQSLYKWELACALDRNFPLPILRARQIADYFKVKPDLFRPDFPWVGSLKFKQTTPTGGRIRPKKVKPTPSNEAEAAQAA
jgi:hypothetical protein